MEADQERWAEALMVERQHGSAGDIHIAVRVTELAATGDKLGIRRWQAIAHRFDQLQGGTVQ